MAQLWTDFQQTCISVARLGDILNTRTEVPPTDAAELPMLQGRITLNNVTCSYRPESPPVLNAMSLEVRPGEVIGILPPQQSSEPALRHSACPATNTWLHLVLMLRWPTHLGAPGKPTNTDPLHGAGLHRRLARSPIGALIQSVGARAPG